MVRWVIGVAISDTLILLILAWLIPGFKLHSLTGAVLTGLTITIVISLAWPIIYWIAHRFHPLLFPLISFLLTAVVVFYSADFVNAIKPDSVTLDGFWDTIFVVMGLAFGNTMIGALFSVNDDRAYERFVLNPLARSYSGTPHTDAPGFIFIEIDGLARPILERAIAEGYMPTLKRWLEKGNHALSGWEPDLSSQTSASQAGILLGDNTDIPAFRWWDKPSGTMMVSSKMQTARELEGRLSTGDGLLATDGGSRFNVFSGDAADCVATFSTIGLGGSGQRSYIAYFSNPFMLARTFGLLFSEVVRELYQARKQRVQDVEPRVHRGFKYSFVRGGTNVFLQEAGAFMVAADMLRGVPAVYGTFFAYDEVAHHSGIDRPDSLKVLRKLDQMIARLEGVALTAPRPYHLVVLSDHGQSQGATFRQRFGLTLGELVAKLTQGTHDQGPDATDEGFSGLSAALTEAVQHDSRTARLARRLLREDLQDGTIDLGAEEEVVTDTTATESSHAVVLASGNLGLISFPAWPERMSLEQLTDQFPLLVPELAGHPGVSFLLIKSDEDGGVVIGPNGIYFLDHGYASGDDPLAKFGPNAAAHLRRTNTFTTAPDILVISMYDPVTGEVAAFEELVGSHGGLGGTQTEPFLLYPATLPLDHDKPIVGAASLHKVLKNWIKDATPQVDGETGATSAH